MSEFEELISKLLEKVPELSRSVIEERINEKKEKVGAGYLTDQGAIFLVAADLGVTLEQTQKSEVAIKDLYIGAKEVTLESRVLNISPTKQFTKKDGSSFSLRTITVYDNNSTASVKLWDEKANLPGLEELKINIWSTLYFGEKMNQFFQKSSVKMQKSSYLELEQKQECKD